MTIHIVTYKELRNRILKTPFASIGVDQIHRKIELLWYNSSGGDYGRRNLGISEKMIIVVGTYSGGGGSEGGGGGGEGGGVITASSITVGIDELRTIALDPNTLDVISFLSPGYCLLADTEYLYCIEAGNEENYFVIIDYNGEIIYRQPTVAIPSALLPKRVILPEYVKDKIHIFDVDSLSFIKDIELHNVTLPLSDITYFYTTYEQSGTYYLVKIDKDGNILASSPVSSQIASSVHDIVASEDKIIVYNYSNMFQIFDKKDLKLIRTETLNDISLYALSCNNGYLYIPYTRGKENNYYDYGIIKYDIKNFRIEFDNILLTNSNSRYTMCRGCLGIYPDDYVYLNVLYNNGKYMVIGIDNNGEKIWELETTRYSIPVLTPSGKLIINTPHGLCIVDRMTGEEIICNPNIYYVYNYFIV